MPLKGDSGIVPLKGAAASCRLKGTFLIVFQREREGR